MVNVLPFNGLRFNTERIKDMSKVIAPPYDVISADQDKYLKTLDPFNIVHLTLPESGNDFNKYESAEKKLSDWISKETLVFDSKQSFYIFEESFSEDGINKSFTGLIGLLKVEEYGAGGILRHEKTLSKPKEDRLKLLTACRTNFEFIYTIYNDSDNNIGQIIDMQKNSPALLKTDADYDRSLKFRFWSIQDDEVILKITDMMRSKTLLIADGHHRYETSRLYRESTLTNKRASGTSEIFSPEDYILTLFVSSNQKEISIHPTHRLIKFKSKIDPSDFTGKIGRYFNIEKIKPEASTIEQAMKKSVLSGQKSFCVCLDAQTCYFAVFNTEIESAYRAFNLYEEPFDREFEYLDVNILHKLVLTGLLSGYEIEDIKFLHTVNEVFKNLASSNTVADSIAGFILNAPQIDTVESLSIKGMIMPQKSTYFYPKPCSGLVMYKFDNSY